ncbi:hypothetical protein RB195_016851 [Necator americanus]|uniref:Core-2/I-Branching enzyme n=1 Tax=Necator americanus TaxID=51031 RepID=A0ABR1C2G2_NECAM
MSISQEQLQAIIFYQWGRGTAVNIDSTLRKDTTTIRTVYLLFACFAKENMIFDEKSRIRSTSPHRVILDVAKEQVLSYRRSADSMNPSYLHGWHAVHPVIHLSNSSPSVSKDLVKEDLVTVDKSWDYDLIVDELRSSYHPQNNFCYSIDRKADETFRFNIRQLARCFSNILITPEEFDVTAGGYNMNKAHYMCMRMLLKEKGWEYVLLLQNHDVIIKSPYEMVEIYSLLGGANDVHVSRCPEELCSPEMKWTPRSLKLFLNESGTSSKTLDTTIELAKGAVQVSLSRAAVQWLIDTVNLTTILEKLNKKTYGYDEIMMASLQVNEELGMPGRFTSDCLSQGKDTRSISRLSTWKNGPNVKCKSGYARKSICIFGIEDFPSILKYPHVMANKMLPEFDYAIIECIHEVIFNRTFLNQDDHPLDKSYYANMPNVRYNRNRKRPISNFKLTCVRSQDEIDDSYTRAKVVV